MTVLIFLTELFANFIETYIGIKIAGILFETRRDKKKTEWMAVGISFVIALLVYGCNRIEEFSYVIFFGGIVCIIFAIWMLYQCKLTYVCLITSFYFMCLGYLDFFSISMVGYLLKDSDYPQMILTTTGFPRIRQILISKLLLIAVYLLVKHFVKEKFQSNRMKHYVLLLLAGMAGLIYLAENTRRTFRFSVVIDWITFGVIMALAVTVAVLFQKRRYEIDSLHFMEMRNKLLQENYQNLNQAYTANAKLYHDFNNHMNVLYQFLIRGDTKMAMEYLDNISEPVHETMKKIWTGNDVVDVVINSKLSKMEKENIKVSVNVEFPGNTDILQNDVCTILSNLLDNAIEACEKNKDLSNKWINITIRTINQMILFKIENGLEEKPRFKNMKLITTKVDKTFHGWGMKSVGTAIEKYDGVMQYAVEENKFSVVVTLNFNLIA